MTCWKRRGRLWEWIRTNLTPIKMAAKKKILIIEDDPVAVKAFEEQLGREFELGYAYDGEQGLEKLKKDKPDLIILDIIMPKLPGFDVLQRIKADPDVRDIPVIIVSNMGQDVEIQKGKKLGAVEYFIKTELSLSTLLNKIREVLD